MKQKNGSPIFMILGKKRVNLSKIENGRKREEKMMICEESETET